MALWSKTKTGGKAGFDKLYGWVDKLGAPVNRLSNKLGSEAFWPTTMDKECDKAARILQSFCKDGFYQEEERPTQDGPKTKQRVLKKIPAQVIKNARGLAIFTTMRTGLWVSGAGGSGVLIGRQADGSWSPPSGIMLHTAGLGFLVGVDIYDCVVVINSQQALDAFSTIRCTLGGEISAVAGPVGVGGVLESEVHKRQAPVFTYLKSRGFYAGVQVDGTIIIERSDENAAFYGERIPVKDIIAGKVRHPPFETKKLLAVVKAAQGDIDVDESLLPKEPPPGDYEVASPTESTFGVPAIEDPDPYGVLALQNAGLDIKEAGTHKRPTSEQFEFNPAPTSPLFNNFRHSVDRSSADGRSVSRRSSWRTSTISSVLEPRTPVMVSMSTQTDFVEPPPIKMPPPLPPRHNRTPSPTLPDIMEVKTTEEHAPRTSQEAASPADVYRLSIAEDESRFLDEADAEPAEEVVVETPIIETPWKEADRVGSTTHKDAGDNASAPKVAIRDSIWVESADLDDAEEDEPVIAQVHQATAPQVITRARIVQVPKAIPPKLPARNPDRKRRSAEPSPPQTPSLQEDDSSTTSFSSVEGLDHVEKQPTVTAPAAHQEPQKQESVDVATPLESPIKNVPGGFL